MTNVKLDEGRVWHDGMSFCLFEGQKLSLRDAVAQRGDDLVGRSILSKYDRMPVYFKFFDQIWELSSESLVGLRCPGSATSQGFAQGSQLI